MKYLYGLVVALLLSTGIVYACAEGEVWQSDISYENGQCTETVQSWSDNHGFRPLLGRWGCENVWHGTWFGRQCHITGHIINTCVAYEQVEVDNGQCVAVDDGNEDEGEDGMGDDDDGNGNDVPTSGGSVSSSGNTAQSQYRNLTGQDPVNMTLQEIIDANWNMVLEVSRKWDLIVKNRNN